MFWIFHKDLSGSVKSLKLVIKAQHPRGCDPESLTGLPGVGASLLTAGLDSTSGLGFRVQRERVLVCNPKNPKP